MKKLLALLFVTCALAGCASETPAPTAPDGAAGTGAAAVAGSGEVTDADVVEVTEEAVQAEPSEHVDEIDLTSMSPRCSLPRSST